MKPNKKCVCVCRAIVSSTRGKWKMDFMHFKCEFDGKNMLKINMCAALLLSASLLIRERICCPHFGFSVYSRHSFCSFFIFIVSSLISVPFFHWHFLHFHRRRAEKHNFGCWMMRWTLKIVEDTLLTLYEVLFTFISTFTLFETFFRGFSSCCFCCCRWKRMNFVCQSVVVRITCEKRFKICIFHWWSPPPLLMIMVTPYAYIVHKACMRANEW